MVDAFVGQVCITAGTYAPRGWIICDGSTLQVEDYMMLFAVIGTQYGGNGYTTFKLPDLRGRIPNHRGDIFHQGTIGGWTHVQITNDHLPAHTHILKASTNDATVSNPTDNVLAVAQSRYSTTLYNDFDTSAETSLTQSSLKEEGGSQPLSTMPPYLTLNFIINYDGYFPSRT